MAADDGTTTSRLIGERPGDARAFSFARLVTLLEAAAGDCAPVGHLGPVAREAVRFRVNTSLGFPAADVEAAYAAAPAGPGAIERLDVVVNFLGLVGAGTPLPPHYAEAVTRDGEDETNVRDFLDLFHHRLLSLLYRTWKKYRYHVQYQPGGGDAYSRWLLSLIGLGHLRLDRDTRLDGDRLLSYLGLLSMRSHSASIVAGIVSHYFGGVRVGIDQCVPRRVTVPAAQRNALGRRNTILGDTLVLGAGREDLGGKFRLTLGPLSAAQFFTFLPDGEHFEPLRELIGVVLSALLEFDVELTVPADEAPPLGLAADGLCRLGWSTWLGTPAAAQLSVVQPGRVAA